MAHEFPVYRFNRDPLSYVSRISQIRYQNHALDVSFSKKIFSGRKRSNSDFNQKSSSIKPKLKLLNYEL